MAYSDLILESSPKYYFRFDNGGVQNVGSDTTITIDSGASTTFPTTGGILNSGRAVTTAYDNTNYGLQVSQQSQYISDKVFTVSGWFKVASADLTTNSHYILRTAANVNQGVILTKSAGNMVLYAVFGNAQVGGGAGTSPSLSYDVWHHFAITCDTSNIKLYIDGSLIDTQTAPSTTPADGIQYWFRYTGSSTRYGVLGQFDEMALFDSTLSATTIASHYNYVNGASISASVSTASGLFVNPVISAQKNNNYSATALTASSLMGDTAVSNINIVKLLNKYLTDLDLETYLKFDSTIPYNYGDAGQTQFYSIGSNTAYELGGPDSAPYVNIGGSITTNILLPNPTEPLWNNAYSDDEWALGFWVKPSTSNTTILEFRQDDGMGGQYTVLSIGTNSSGYPTTYYETSSGNSTLTGTSSIVNGNWHFIVIKYSVTAEDFYLYVDGDFVANGNLSGANVGVYDATFHGTNAISSFFLDTYSKITASVIEEIYDTAIQSIQAQAYLPMPKVSISTAYYDKVATYSPIMEFKLDGTGVPVNSGSNTLTLSLIGDSADISVNELSKNIYSYNFADKESYYSGYWSGNAFDDDQQTLVVLAKVDPALMDEGNTVGFGAFKILFSTNMGNGGGLQIGAYSNPVGTSVPGYTPEGSGFYAYLPDAGYAREIVLASDTLDSNWHLLVATKNGADFKFYVDGILVDFVDDVDFAMASDGTALLGGGEVFWWGEDPGITDKTIDHVAVLDVELTAQQVFELWQSVGVDAITASGLFVLPVGTAGYGPTINPGVMYVSALLVDPTQQDTVAPTVLPMTAFATTVTPNFAATSTATIAASPMTASAETHDPTWNIGEINSATHMHASAEFVNPQVFIPGFYNANPMIANPASMVQPGFTSTRGGLVIAQPMTATASLVIPPAYKTLFDDKWYDLLYSQHSIRHNFRAVNGGNGEAILKLFDDVTTSKAAGTTIKNNLPTTITSDGININTAEPNLNLVADFTPSNNTPLLSTGFFDDYERKAVRFNNITTGYEDSEYITTGFSLELSIKTTKQNQIIAFGKTRNFYGNQQYSTAYGLSDGKLFIKSTAAIGPAPISHYKETLSGDTLIGNKNIADGQWHHIVIQAGWDDNRVQFWVDGELDRQKIGVFRLDGPSFLGFNSQSNTYASDFLTSAWSYDSHSFPREYEIDAHRYAYIKYEPVLAAPMIASLTSGDHIATSNRARALMLYWWPTDSFQNPPLTTKQFNTTGFPDIETWTTELTTADFIKRGPQEYYGWDVFPVDITGYFVSDLVKPEAYGGKQHIKVGSKPFIGTGQNYNTNPEYLYNDQGTFRDPITDAPRYIDLVKDIDLRNFDAIFFKNFPDDTKEKESYTAYEDVDTYFGSKEAQLYDAFIKSLREAVDTGISLYVTNPQLAIDLGIVDRIEIVPDMDELVGFDSDPYTPTIVPSNASVLSIENAAAWADTYKNNKLRIVNTLEGFTTEPSFIRTDRAHYYNDDANSFGAPDRPFARFVYRPNGLQVGDELIISNDPQNVLGISNAKSYLAAPFANVKSGTIITAFANTVKRRTETIANPYANYATCIVVKPGDQLNGTQCGGKIVVNFTENLNGAADWGDVDLISDYWINVAYNDGFITETEKNTYLAASYNIDRQLENNIISQTEYNKLAFWSSNGMYILGEGTIVDDPTASTPKSGLGKGERSAIVTKTRKSGTSYAAKVSTSSQWFSFSYSWQYPRMGIKVPSILTRGFWWLSNRESYDGIVERPLAATASAVFVEPVVTGQKDRSINAQAMISSATIVQSDGTSASAINIAPLPMQAVGTMGNIEKRYIASPMTASAILRTNNRIFTTAVDEVVVYVYHTDPILYLREDVIK